jgi:hypothetical protein
LYTLSLHLVLAAADTGHPFSLSVAFFFSFSFSFFLGGGGEGAGRTPAFFGASLESGIELKAQAAAKVERPGTS